MVYKFETHGSTASAAACCTAWPEVPIVLMSAELDKWERADIYDCGADGVLEKPFDTKRLGRMIERLIAEGRPAREPGTPEQ